MPGIITSRIIKSTIGNIDDKLVEQAERRCMLAQFHPVVKPIAGDLVMPQTCA